MDYECSVRELEPQPVMSIRGRTTGAALSATIGEYLGEVWQYVEAQGGSFAGPPFTRYHAMSGDELELEAGLPVVAPLADSGRTKAGTLPGGEAVSTVHIGPYEQLQAAHAALEDWTAQHGRTAAGPSWEVYWTDPGEVPDPAAWKTEVIKPLQSQG